jgi:diguanylate cyclase (GGDEF)-like protein/PAS domain S-box-containing protein
VEKHAQELNRLVQERHRIELHLRESEKKYRDLLEHLPVGVYVTTPSGDFIEANNSLAVLLGYDEPKELKNVNVQKFYVKTDDRREHLKKLDMSLTYFSEFELKRKDGKIICVRDFPRAVLGGDGEITHYTGILVDVTEQRETERQLHKALVDLENSNRERQTVIAKLESLSLLDDLTKLYNRRGFLVESRQQLKKAQQSRTRVFFLFMDLDNLKWINDSWGHQKGDEALRHFASILQSALRRSDIKGRLGGDEFAILVMESEDLSPEILIDRLQAKIDAFNEEHQLPFPLSISMGVSFYDPEFPCSVDELLIRADKLMYEQKREKRRT